MGRLDGKVAIVTGGGSGIGEATATLFAAEGAAVAVVDVRGDAAEAVAGRIREAGGRAIAAPADVSRPEDAERLVWESIEAFGALHILHNNAGVLIPGTVVTLTVEDWHRTLAVNVTGAFLCSRFAVPTSSRAGTARSSTLPRARGSSPRRTSPPTARARARS